MRVYNIFCDASIDPISKISVSGCIILDKNIAINKEILIKYDSTNNAGEILAIHLAIQEAIKLNKMDTEEKLFRIFSDSRISIFGLREWLPSWIRNQKYDVLISDTGNPIANQIFFIEIYNMIIQNHLNVEFYAQKGHVKNNLQSLETAEKYFYSTNGIHTIELGFSIQRISELNNEIDRATKDILKRNTNMSDQYNNRIYYKNPIIPFINNLALPEYLKCINKEEKQWAE